MRNICEVFVKLDPQIKKELDKLKEEINQKMKPLERDALRWRACRLAYKKYSIDCLDGKCLEESCPIENICKTSKLALALCPSAKQADKLVRHFQKKGKL